jgi:riboflavin biosynthesis pyrimidine reductase
MRVLLDETASDVASSALGGSADLARLAAAYAPPAGAPSWVRGVMVTTLDGSAQGGDGRSGTINTGADHVVFELLRALADVVLVGAGTVRAEGYGPLRIDPRYAAVRAGAGRAAALPLVIVSDSGQLPERVLEQDDAAPVIAAVPTGCARIAFLQSRLGADGVLALGEGGVDLPAVLGALHDRGLRRVDCEGGPSLLGELLALDLVDELALTLSPVVVGGEHRRIVAGAAIDRSFTPAVLVEQDGTVLGRWLRAR